MAEDEKTPAIPAEPESPDTTETEDESAVDLIQESAEADAVEAEPAANVDAASTDAEVPGALPKAKRQRLPRRLRTQKTRPRRTTAAGVRKPVVREPKPEHERGRRQERRGVVVSSAMDKTIVVKVELIKSHPRYKKVVRRSVKFHAHDEQNAAKVGDVVRIVETRPLSATKHWRLAEVLEAAK